MATTENNYTGDGSTTLYPFTFEYINNQDVKVQLDGTDTTEYTLANATTVSMNTAPASGVAVRVYRLTDTDSVPATFYSGSTIQASDLNENFNQTLFVSQEVSRDAALASAAYPTAARAEATADAAESTADAAAADAATAISTANSAVTTANGAVTTANTAETNSNIAISTAEAAAAAVSDVVTYTLVANVAAIPTSPADGDRVEVVDSTGIESFTPLTGVPVGFVGDAGKSARISYSLSGTTWQWIGYIVTDPEGRYAQITGQSFTGTVVAPDFTGTLLGNVTGDVIGNVTGDLFGNVTGDTAGTHTGPVTGDVTGNLIGNADTATNATQADNAAMVNGLIASQFIRSDANDSVSGTITFNGPILVRDAIDLADNDILRFGNGDDAEMFCNGSHLYLDLNSGIGNFYIRDGTTTRFTFNDNGNFTATGNINANGNLSVGGVISSGLGNSLANLGYGAVGSYGFMTLRGTTGDKNPGITVSAGGGTLRWSNASGANYSSSSPSGTWRLQGRLEGSSSDSDRAETSLWIRIA